MLTILSIMLIFKNFNIKGRSQDHTNLPIKRYVATEVCKSSRIYWLYIFIYLNFIWKIEDAGRGFNFIEQSVNYISNTNYKYIK